MPTDNWMVQQEMWSNLLRINLERVGGFNDGLITPFDGTAAVPQAKFISQEAEAAPRAALASAIFSHCSLRKGVLWVP